MTKIDVFSGFLGAGKTTLIKKLLKEAYAGEKLVLIENEFGEIGIDGGFMKDAGIQVTEMNQGCICCSLVGDFGKALAQVLEQFHPDRILIEPSGVGKLSDVLKAVMNVHSDPGVEGIRNQKLSDMDNRLEIIQSYPDSIFLCIHQNNYTDPKYFGGQMFYNNNNPDNRTLAQIMQARFAQLQPGNDREIKLSGDELFLLKSNKNPSLMIECGFLSNPEEEAKLATEEYQQQLAFTIYSGVLEYVDAVSEQPESAWTDEEAAVISEYNNITAE